MSMDNLIISNIQAKKIAHSVYNDIATYIKSHSDEYQQWLIKNRKEADNNAI